MANAGHTLRAHSPIGPSSMERHFGCPASRRLSAGEPNNDTFFTRQGTAAHEFAEFITRKPAGYKATEWLGGVIDLAGTTPKTRFYRCDDPLAPEVDEWTTWPIDDEQIDGALLYRDTLHALVEPGCIFELETRIDITHVNAELFGTSDAYIFNPKTGLLIVADYKYGRGYAVDAEENPQLLTYAVGIYNKLKAAGFKIKTIRLLIIQPRAYHIRGEVRDYETTAADLRKFEAELKVRLAKTEDPKAVAEAGDHCKWCPAAYRCDTLRDYIYEIIGATIDPDGEAQPTDMPKVERMSRDALGRVMRAAQIIENWIRRVFAKAHSEALDGRVPTGMKLVDKRAYRKWIDQTKVIQTLDELGYSEDEYMTEPELRTVAQIEKMVGKKRFKALADLSKKSSSGFVLAPIEDARPAVNPDRSAAFGAVDDEDY